MLQRNISIGERMMSRHLVEEAGTRFFELATSLGRFHERTLKGLADATAKTPAGPFFAINASLARMANDGMETLAGRLSGTTIPAGSRRTDPAAEAPSATVDAPKRAKAPGRARTPAPFTVETAPDTAVAEAIEPEVEDVLVDEIVAEAALPGKPASVIKDDLTLITGIGAATARKLNDAGIESFAQIAGMSEDGFADLLSSLEIRSIRFSPATWIAEAKTYAA